MAYPTLDQNDADNRILVGVCILDFLKKDPYVKELATDSFGVFAKDFEMIKNFSEIFLEGSPKTENVVPWFMDRVFTDLAIHKQSNKEGLKKFIDKLSKIDLVNLNCMYDISNKYSITQIKSFRLLIEELDSKNPDKIDKTKFMISFFRDAIFHSEIIILSYYYKQWFGEVYQADVSGWESYDSWRYINDEDSQLNQKNPSNMADKPEPTKVA